MARTTIPSELVAINAIHGTLIADNAITAVHIATNAVSGTLIADNAVTSTHIAQNHVTGTQIAQNTITVTHIADSAVETAKINNDAVTQAKIADDAVGADQLAANAVVSASIANGTIVAADLADDAVTIAKMAALARGKIIYGDSAGNPAALALGSSGQVLTTDGTDISWGSGFNADAAQVFNESGNDADFRVESNGNANMLFVDGGGDSVNIGTTTNTYNAALVVNNESGELGFDVTDGTTHVGIWGTGALGTIGTRSNHSLSFKTNDSERMRIDSNGDMLLGQTSQTGYTFAQKLVVGDGDANDGITIQSGSTHQGNLAFNHSDGTTAYGRILYQHNSNYMSFFTNNAERLRIDSLGNLSSAATGGHVQIDNGIGVTTRETMAASSHAWQTDTYNVLSAGSTSIGTDSTGTTHMWFNSYDTGNKYSVKAGHSADLYHGITDGQFVLRMSGNPTTSNGEGITMLQRLYIDKEGTFQLHSAGTNDTTIKFYKGASTVKWWMQNDTGGSPGSDSFWIGDEENDNGVYVGQDGSSWSGISDERLKRNWTNLTGACDKLDTLTKVGTFQRRGKTSGNWSDNREVGMSAQEVEAILPEAVTTGGDIEFASDDKVTGVKGMSYEKLVPLLVKAIQELNTRLKAVE